MVCLVPSSASTAAAQEQLSRAADLRKIVPSTADHRAWKNRILRTRTPDPSRTAVAAALLELGEVGSEIQHV